MLRKRWRATVWCGKSKYAISSGWLKEGSASHPDDIITLASPIRMRYQPQLGHANDIRWKGMSSGWVNYWQYLIRDAILPIVKSSGWDTANRYVIRMRYWKQFSNPDEILKIVKSSGWLRDQINYLIRMTYGGMICLPRTCFLSSALNGQSNLTCLKHVTLNHDKVNFR